MNCDWLYIAITQRFLECRRAAHEGAMTVEDAGDVYVALADELAELYDYEVVEHAMSEFTSDLKLLTFMERVDQLGWLAIAVGYLTGFFVSEKRIDRVMQLNEAILQLDAQYNKPKKAVM